MPGLFLTVNPWDLVDEGADSVLDRLQGEIGVSGVTLVAAAPPMTLLRVRPVTPRVLRTRGGLLFQPREELYAATRLRPGTSDTLRRKPALAESAERCRARGLGVRLELPAATLGRVLPRYPDAGCRNALDDRSALGMCLNQPDVEALIGALLADVTSQVSCDGMVLRAWRTRWEEAYRAEPCGDVGLSKTTRNLLGMCFCESCLRKSSESGVDGAAAKRFVTTALEAAWASPGASPADYERLVEEHDPLRQFTCWRAESMAATLARLVKAAPCPLAVVLDEPVWAMQVSGSEIAKAGVQVLRMIEPGGLWSDEVVAGQERMLSDDYAMRMVAAEVVAEAQRAARAGCAAVHFGNFGCLSDAALTGIKQAIRFARRAGI